MSLREEIEAIDWYDQRIDATADDELRAILTHNGDEEKEHAALTLAWLAKRDAAFAREVSEKVVHREGPDDEAAAPASGDGSLGIGSLRAQDDLQRRLAPISARAWRVIERTAVDVLTVNLAARKLVDFRGPLGWTASAVELGTVDALPTPPVEGVAASLRRVQPLVGRDVAIGYSGHTTSAVQLFLVESFTFEVLTPEAAVWIALA